MKRKTNSIFGNLKAGDSLTIIFLNLISLFSVLFYNKINVWWMLLLGNLGASAFIIFLTNYAHNKKGIIRIIRDWYWYPFILIIFKEIYILIQSLGLSDQDKVLIFIDKMIFGVNPTQWFYQFANPLLTEYLQLCYSMFYFILLSVPFFAYIKKNYNEYYYSYFVILLGFYVSYVGYLLVPAIGPRFTLHDFYAMNSELPGLFFYKGIRMLINFGESITPDTLTAAALAQRDCFPSGHTEMTILAMYLSFKYNQKIKWILLLVGMSLIIATVYLRYHYVIDVIAGSFCALFVIVIAHPISVHLERRTNYKPIL
jgi:membrane-associated phospholipid phosphatase